MASLMMETTRLLRLAVNIWLVSLNALNPIRVFSVVYQRTKETSIVHRHTSDAGRLLVKASEDEEEIFHQFEKVATISTQHSDRRGIS